MYLIEQVEHIYENAKEGTADYLISEFLLMHIRDIKQLSLSDIAKGTDLPKSTVSMYFLSSRFNAGYTDFKNTVSRECGMVNSDIQTHLDWQNQLIGKIAQARSLRRKDIRLLAEKMIQSLQVLFVGDQVYRSCFSSLIYLLRNSGIRSRYILGSCLHEHEEELKKLDRTTLMIYLIPDDTYTEHKFRISINNQMNEYFSTGNAEKIYICKFDRSSENEAEVLPFKAQKNPYFIRISVLLLAADLFVEFALKSGIDLKQECYII